MIDFAWLASWVQAHHWQGFALQSYRQAFASHPARLLVLRQFLLDSVAEKLSRFLAVEAEFQTVYGLYSVDGGYVTEDEWLAATAEDRYLRFGAFCGPRPEFVLSPNLLTYLQFRQAFRDRRFTALFEEFCGVPLGASAFSVHAMRHGDFLHAHTDAVEDRRLAFVLYLSPDWQPRFGGGLHVVQPGGTVVRIEAEYNSLVVFDVAARTEHLVGLIEPTAGETVRLSLGGWISRPA
jgi:Rps23 Pro-64 3,4-dihydroxylase Tpa1-like proline 4-hydroxylase